MNNRERARASGDQNSSGFQGENMSGGEESKVNGSTDISVIKRVTRKLKEVSLFSRAKHNTQCLSGLSRALFWTTFLEIAVYLIHHCSPPFGR